MGDPQLAPSCSYPRNWQEEIDRLRADNKHLTERLKEMDLISRTCDALLTETERLQAIVGLLSKQDGKPIIHLVDPEDGTAERLGVVFRYSLDKRDEES